MGGISSDDETDSDEDEMERLRSLSIRTGVSAPRLSHPLASSGKASTLGNSPTV